MYTSNFSGEANGKYFSTSTANASQTFLFLQRNISGIYRLIPDLLNGSTMVYYSCICPVAEHP